MVLYLNIYKNIEPVSNILKNIYYDLLMPLIKYFTFTPLTKYFIKFILVIFIISSL